MSDITYPHTEDQEMGKVKEIFDRALNAMVNASTLAKDVDQLKVDLDTLKTQVTHYRNTIANQDDQITRLRQDRDAARTAQYHAEDATRHNANALESAKRDLENTMSANMRLNDRVSELTKERDDAQFKLLELQESHSALSTKLDAVKAHMQSVFGALEPPKPVETTQSMPVTLQEPVQEPDWQPRAEPEPKDWWDEKLTPQNPEAPVNPPETESSQSLPEDIKRW